MLTARTTFNKTAKLSHSSSSFHTSQRILADSRRKEALPDEKQSSALVGSDKLFADAALEESQEAKGVRPARSITHEHENWTGEESMQDAVLRMLVDKYKPLRSGPILSADEKLKANPPKVGEVKSPPNHLRADEPLLPGVEGHKPWLTTFKPPSHTINVKHGHIKSSSPSSSARTLPEYERERRREREARRSERAARLTRAKEGTLDYRLGQQSAATRVGEAHRSNPVSLRGWASLVEERIERARQEGRFGKITGRGKPITRISDEGNPFIAREEFLMNRIVQRNGAAPPWVELQGELDTALASFREIVKQSWTRRCMRILSSEYPLPLLARITPAQIASVRDPMWEAREAGYHNTALAEINSLVRRYNGVAPYPVRRTIYEREPELEKVYSECVDDVLREIDVRVKEGGVVRSVSGFTDGEDDRGGGGAGGSARYDSRPGSFSQPYTSVDSRHLQRRRLASRTRLTPIWRRCPYVPTNHST